MGLQISMGKKQPEKITQLQTQGSSYLKKKKKKKEIAQRTEPRLRTVDQGISPLEFN